LDLGNPDFIKLAESFGAHGLRVEKKHDFVSVMQKALANTGVTIVEVLFQYPQKVE
jgi:acetolactate synthase-1/2/3 large subunit